MVAQSRSSWILIVVFLTLTAAGCSRASPFSPTTVPPTPAPAAVLPTPIRTTVPPTATPATPQERYDRFFWRFYTCMARLKRDVGRIEQAISEDEMNNVYYIGLHINSNVATLDDLDTPSAADIIDLGISQDAELMKSTYQRLLGDLQPCRAYGARASLYYPLDSVLEAYQACRSRIETMEDLTPQIFVCPNDHPSCKMP